MKFWGIKKMRKTHDLHRVVVDSVQVNYFYTKEKKDINGNSRFRVYILDPGAPAIHETIFKCYESQIKGLVTLFIEGATQ